MKIKLLLLAIICQSYLFGSEIKSEIKLEKDWPEMSIFNLQDDWKNHKNQKFNLADFTGKPVIAAMVYTSCQHSCPMITSKMISLRQALPEELQDKITYALISFDPEGDTPEALNAYKVKRNLDDNWVLLTSNDKNIRKLAGVLGVNYKKMTNGDFSHSNIISLIDKDGVVLMQTNGLNKKVDGMLEKLKTIL